MRRAQPVPESDPCRAHGVRRRHHGQRIGKEEIFGPILSILEWNDEEKMLPQVNQVEYGLTCSI
jgi:acyl-CoA reductase-like NAD-dependent aldehyde dehydrogenase